MPIEASRSPIHRATSHDRPSRRAPMRPTTKSTAMSMIRVTKTSPVRSRPNIPEMMNAAMASPPTTRIAAALRSSSRHSARDGGLRWTRRWAATEAQRCATATVTVVAMMMTVSSVSSTKRPFQLAAAMTPSSVMAA